MPRKTTKTVETKKHSGDLHVRVEPVHQELFEKAAEEAGLSLSAWIRTRLLAAAKKEVGR